MRIRSVLQVSIFLALYFFSPPRESGALAETPGQSLVRSSIHKAIIHGIEILYECEFKRAEELFQEIIDKKPEDPVGYFYLAMVSWHRLASGFWSSDVLIEYEKRIDRCIAVAKEKIKNRNADSFTYFYLGGALGFK